MAQVNQLPCDGDGICMLCKAKLSDEDILTCNTCVTPWHAACLSTKPETLAGTLKWECPDCSPVSGDFLQPIARAITGGSNDLLAAVRSIEADESLTEKEKAKKRQQLLTGKGDGSSSDLDDDEEEKKKKKGKNKSETNDVLNLLDENFKCSFCMQLPDRPVSTPCGHNFCLKCFQKWIAQGKHTCIKCRSVIPQKMYSQPRINLSLVSAIREAKTSKSLNSGASSTIVHFVQNENRPDKAFTTERAKKSGKANACSGKIFVTVPPDHFGPILAENEPVNNRGVLVGDSWEDRMECRQWGAHLPHVAGIAGQSDYGAQSVALSGGYQDDEDHGEWFLYTGSGGRDLSGNKRTNKDQSFDQKFEKMNEALRVSCKKGYPVRVVRSHKERRSSYAPETGVRYDGVYRIEKCWRKVGMQGFSVCRYLFVRCDNEPAPWTSDEHGDRPRPLPAIQELKKATDITERNETPSWDFDEEEACWKWTKPSPPSKKTVNTLNPEERKAARAAIRNAQHNSVREKLLKEFSCRICQKVMNLPVTTPCAHNFCKHCLEGVFAGQTFVRERSAGRRTLRAQKNVMKCPACPTDISDFLKDLQVNREMMEVIENLHRMTAERETEEADEIVDTLAEESEDEDKENSELSGCPNKRRKVDGNDSRKFETDALKPAAMNGETDDMQVEAAELKKPAATNGKTEDMEIEANKVAITPEDAVSKMEGEMNSMSNSSEDEKREGNDSPLSPLLVR